MRDDGVVILQQLIENCSGCRSLQRRWCCVDRQIRRQKCSPVPTCSHRREKSGNAANPCATTVSKICSPVPTKIAFSYTRKKYFFILREKNFFYIYNCFLQKKWEQWEQNPQSLVPQRIPCSHQPKNRWEQVGTVGTKPPKCRQIAQNNTLLLEENSTIHQLFDKPTYFVIDYLGRKNRFLRAEVYR